MDTLAFLGDLTPAFAVRGCQVKVLSEPSEFYNELCTRARLSKRRICMAALYLGTFSVPNFGHHFKAKTSLNLRFDFRKIETFEHFRNWRNIQKTSRGCEA